MKSPAGILLPIILLVSGPHPPGGTGIEGTWKFIPGRSTDIASWGNSLPQVDISAADGSVRVIHNWLERGKVAFADTFECRPGGGGVTSTLRSEIWPANWYMGVLSSVRDARTVSGLWLDPGKSFRVFTVETLRTSQGKTRVSTIRDYMLGPDGKTLTLSEKRSSRPTPVLLFFERKEASR